MTDQKVPTAQEIEEAMLKKSEDSNPLDIQAAIFSMYIPRFQGQLNFMSKKQMRLLMTSLAGSEYNKPEDVNKLLAVTNNMNLNGIKRVIKCVIECPLAVEDFSLLSEQEKKLFTIFDSLLSNKYYTCLKVGLDKKRTNQEEVKELEDIIIHSIDTTSKEFKSRERVEKDAFATASKLLSCKYLMIFSTLMEHLEKEVKNG